ncbi:MAG: serine/threonine-protein kinase [Planctomycetota bacterium]|nr:serine/threonine-protein kinase [Planctomycetota bacterium]
MTIHCPKCGKSFEKSQFPLGNEATCIHCGIAFSPSRKETVPVTPAKNRDAPSAPVHNSQLTPLPGRAEVGGQLAGYHLERELGRGGMGVVYLANQESLGRKVAVKVLPKDLCNDEDFVRRFEREAQSLAKLNHPNIVSILDKGREEGTYYFVMEFVDGVSLRQILEEKRLTPNEALRIVKQICDGLEYAHQEGVVHRDIKPENILIDRKGNAKIADFGLARLIRGEEPRSRITRSQMVMGSPDYMAPEQREKPRDVDHRADLFSLGVVLYEMLTGELPLGNFPPPSKKHLGLDVNIDRIVLKVLSKNPEMRYHNASQVATEIEGLSRKNGRPASGEKGTVDSLPLWARGPAREIGSFIKQHPWAVIPFVIAGVCAIGMIFVALPTVGWVLVPLALIAWFWHEGWVKSKTSHETDQAKLHQARARQAAAQGSVDVGERNGKGKSKEARGYSLLGPLVFLAAAVLLIALVVVKGPLDRIIWEEFYSQRNTDEMLGALVGSLAFVVPCLVVFVISFWARARAKRGRLRGRFFASLAAVMMIVTLALFWGGWSDYNKGYRFWRGLERRAIAGDVEALVQYRALSQDVNFERRQEADWSLRRVEKRVRKNPALAIEIRQILNPPKPPIPLAPEAPSALNPKNF